MKYHLFFGIRFIWFLAIMVALLVLGLFTGATFYEVRAARSSPQIGVSAAGQNYIVLAWNDLGMHCYNQDFSDLAVLPPFNTIWAQVIQVGDPPRVITDGLTVEYYFADNTYSAGKTNFWDYDQDLFGVDLPVDVGLAGFGLAGEMAQIEDHFEAIGIPLTEMRDSDLLTPYPYQLATVIVKDAVSGAELARIQPVAPLSTEMHCDTCHYDNGPGNDDFATGVVEQNILSRHDAEQMEDYPAGHEGPLMDRRPVLCAECHAAAALGAAGIPGIPSLSKAMHETHNGRVPDTQEGCYNCHPGPQTECLRDVMSSAQHGMDCIDCHGDMNQVSKNPQPWLNEPRCDNAQCHGSAYQQDQPLYRLSKDHGGVYCAGCHDSPHAIAPSREANDAIKFIDLQGHTGTLSTCTTCHASQPVESGPHGIFVDSWMSIFMPMISR